MAKMKFKNPTYGTKTKAKPKAKKDGGEVKKAFVLIGKNDLSRLLEQAGIFQSRASSANGSRSELVADYVKRKHLHAGAFSLINRLYRLGDRDPQALWLLLAHFDDMRAKAGLDRIAKKQGQLLPALADEAEEPAGENVVSYPREVAEQAGENAA